MLTDISDHYPYFIFVNVCPKVNKPHRLVKKRLDSNKVIEDMLTDMNECDISKKLNNDLASDPNSSYDILQDHIYCTDER